MKTDHTMKLKVVGGPAHGKEVEVRAYEVRTGLKDSYAAPTQNIYEFQIRKENIILGSQNDGESIPEAIPLDKVLYEVFAITTSERTRTNYFVLKHPQYTIDDVMNWLVYGSQRIL